MAEMSTKGWVAVLVILGVIILFVPFVPQTQASGRFLGVHYQRSADVSPSYYIAGCGGYVNSQVGAQFTTGYSGFYQLSKGYTFACNYNSA